MAIIIPFSLARSPTDAILETPEIGIDEALHNGNASIPSHTSVDDSRKEEKESECRVYLAPSTIPGAGLGIFAGVDFGMNDVILYGDIAVPIDKLLFHTKSSQDGGQDDQLFIWSDYTWDNTIAGGLNFDYGFATDELMETVELASFGLGAMPNCKFGFVNVHSELTLADNGSLDRNSPGNGAFTSYHERVGLAWDDVPAGSELFEDYGSDYFDNRPSLEHIPHEPDYTKANALLTIFGALREELGQRNNISEAVLSSVLQGVYDIARIAWAPSRVLNALPNADNHRDDMNQFFDTIIEKGAKHYEKERTIRDPSWLKENGVCMDGIRSRPSSIPHAGRGAFSTRSFRKGDTIVPVPMIHIPQKEVLTMYASRKTSIAHLQERDVDNPIGQQLILNYCFGHNESTMLLSPYGSITSLINHGFGLAANARLEWAHDWMTHPEWLEEPPEELLKHNSAGLGWNLVALRDIQPDEEVLISYGKVWEEAWEKHTTEWLAREEIPTGTSWPYMPANDLNDNIEQVLLNAVNNETDYSYMGHGVSLYCYSLTDDAAFRECRPTASYKEETTGDFLFVAEVVEWVENDDDWELVVHEVIYAVDASRFFFEDIPHNMAHTMPWSFRHAMVIPDDLLPEVWKNLS